MHCTLEVAAPGLSAAKPHSAVSASARHILRNHPHRVSATGALFRVRPSHQDHSCSSDKALQSWNHIAPNSSSQSLDLNLEPIPNCLMHSRSGIVTWFPTTRVFKPFNWTFFQSKGTRGKDCIRKPE